MGEIVEIIIKYKNNNKKVKIITYVGNMYISLMITWIVVSRRYQNTKGVILHVFLGKMWSIK